MKALMLDALRNLRSRRGATAVTVGGLMLAMAACMLLALLASALAEIDPTIPEPDRVVMLDFKGNPPGQPSPWFTRSPVSFAPMLKERQVPLDLVSRVGFDGIDINHEGRLQPAFLLIADPDLVTVLGLRTVQGDLRVSLNRHDGIAISTGLVRKLWGELPPAQAMGRRIESRGTFYIVTAVIPNTDPRAPFRKANPTVGDAMAMVGFETQGNPWSEEGRNAIYVINGRVFARLRADTRVEQIGDWMRDAFKANPLYAKLPTEWRDKREAAYFRGLPLKRLPFEGETNELRWQLLSALAAACALLLVLAAFNAINLQAASLLQRQRETALRRSLGADGAQLLRLWGAEVLLPLLLAAAGALLLAWWLAPAAATAIGLSPVHPVADPIALPVLAGLGMTVLALLLLTLLLPAWPALRRATAPALQGRTASEGPRGRRVRQGLLTLQLGGAILLLSLAGVLAVQHHHLLFADRGFETRNRLWLGVFVNPDFIPNMDVFLAALKRHPAVTNIAFSGMRPSGDARGVQDLHVSASQHKQILRVSKVSPSFFETYGMTLLAGSPKTGSGEVNIVIDAKAAKLLGFENPQAAVGALVRGGGGFLQEGNEQRRVVAVIRDVKMESARDPALPQAFVLTDKPQWDITIHGPDLAAVRQAVDELWKAHGPAVPHDTQSADQIRADFYRQEEVLTAALAGVALLAVCVAMLGAYALVADTLRRRRTELVLRRLHGADNTAIVKQVAAEFAIPLLVAAIVALPLSALLGQLYLDGFVDRTSVLVGVVWPLAAASALALIVVALSALRHVRLALALRPIEALG